jgi:hypothetical protein
MIFEDVQWVDPTSLEVLGRTVDRIKILPVLLIVTFRPEFNAPWAGQSHVTSVTLNRLGIRFKACFRRAFSLSGVHHPNHIAPEKQQRLSA